MKALTRTAYGVYLQNALYTGLPFQMFPNTTLNEKLGILEGIAPPAHHYPQLKYFCIGNGAHRYVTNAQNLSKPMPLQHLGTDGSLFKPMPFVLREPNNDLSPQERALYALRREEDYNGKRFIAYYLRRLDTAASKTEMIIMEVDEKGNRLRERPFIPDKSNLNPIPQELSSSGLNIIKGQYVSVKTHIELEFTAEQCEELRNVSNIMYADEGFAIISEIGLVSGLDKNITIAGTGLAGGSQFNEVISAQVCHIAHTYHSAVYADVGFTIDLDAGATEPLFKLDKEAINSVTAVQTP